MSAACDTFKVGTKVRSKPVGTCQPFYGSITGLVRDGYVVRRADNGQDWVRTKHELEVVK